MLRPGGAMVVIEGSNLDDYGSLVRGINPDWFTDQTPVLDFWREQGFQQHLVHTVWRARDRAHLIEAMAMEHGEPAARAIADRFPACSLGMVLRVFHRRFGA